ncbi:hypothetical protein [Lentzea atacamensis]|uniref:hypothetical protein n=1 Tax=Lentzea atacamensis TaxID=531938 RepID=UPI001474FAE8|nr:hypothetical protein [Lentzea atacamensis]
MQKIVELAADAAAEGALSVEHVAVVAEVMKAQPVIPAPDSTNASPIAIVAKRRWKDPARQAHATTLERNQPTSVTPPLEPPPARASGLAPAPAHDQASPRRGSTTRLDTPPPRDPN